MAEPRLKPGDVIGILGGGQLGRMLASAAAELGLSCHIYCPDPQSPAFAVSAAHTHRAATTTKRRSPPSPTPSTWSPSSSRTCRHGTAPVSRRARAPGALAAQPRGRAGPARREGVRGIARHCRSPRSPRSTAATDIYSALARTGRPAILKTRRLGYDGKGQAPIRSGDDPPPPGAPSARRRRSSRPSSLSSARSRSILARARDGSMRAFDIGENRHVNGILAETTVPATVTPEIAAEAVAIAEKIAAALDYVGVLAVEMFVVGAGPHAKILVNEIAPRVHNSGHWTLDAAITSQFEQHIRAIAGWPLGDPDRLADVVMTNLIGDEVGPLAGDCWPSPARGSTSTARPRRGPAARWATSTGSGRQRRFSAAHRDRFDARAALLVRAHRNVATARLRLPSRPCSPTRHRIVSACRYSFATTTSTRR